MESEKITLEKIRKSPKLAAERNFRTSDFISKEEKKELKRSNSKGKAKKFSIVEAFEAEVIARFGYDFFKDYYAGLVSVERVNRYLAAERAREKARLLPIEAMIALNAPAGASLNKNASKAMKKAQKILSDEIRVAEGKK